MKIKLLTLNIWSGGMMFDSVLSLLERESADIVTLQEVNSGGSEKIERRFRSVSEFEKILVYPYSQFDPALFHFEDGEKIEHGNLVLSKFPITYKSNTFIDGSYSEFDLSKRTDFANVPPIFQHVVVGADGKMIDVFNVHGIWGEDGKDNKRRLHMSKLLLSQIQGKENVFLAGDFNVVPDTKTIGDIENELVNVFKRELVSTFNMKHKDKGGYATAVVDMIFVSRDMEVITHYSPKDDVSDHLPLVVEVELI